VAGRSLQAADVSMNSRLFVASDASFGGNIGLTGFIRQFLS